VHTKRHFIVSLIIAIFSLFFDQRTPFLEIRLLGYEITVFILCIVVGVLVDVDHIIDYWIIRGHMSKSLEQRFREGRMFLVFHSIENTVILAVLSILFPFFVFPTITYICHMTMDVYGNGAPYRAYFYLVRFGRKLVNRYKVAPAKIS
jgi:hypothetical protein